MLFIHLPPEPNIDKKQIPKIPLARKVKLWTYLINSYVARNSWKKPCFFQQSRQLRYSLYALFTLWFVPSPPPGALVTYIWIWPMATRGGTDLSQEGDSSRAHSLENIYQQHNYNTSFSVSRFFHEYSSRKYIADFLLNGQLTRHRWFSTSFFLTKWLQLASLLSPYC
jgi:hypothetical protein